MNRHASRFRKLLLVLGALLVAPAAQAQGVELKSTVQVEQQVEVDGATSVRLVEPTAVVPGDKLVFATRYENNGAESAEDVVITNTVHSAVSFSGAMEADTSQVSVDGGATWGQLGTLTVSDGSGGRRPAQPADVTHVRWTISSVVPGGNGTVSYRGIVK